MEEGLIWWILHQRASKVPRNLMLVWVVNFGISSTMNFHRILPKKCSLLTASSVLVLFLFLVQKGAGSSSFSTNLQRNHSIGGLHLQADVSTDSCVSSSVFRIVNIINFIIHHIHSSPKFLHSFTWRISR